MHFSRLRRRAVAVLASFVVAVVVTMLAPFLHATTWETVCSASGSKLVATHGGDHDPSDDAPTDHGMHCPLCLPTGTPPAMVAWDFTPVQPLAFVLQGMPAARLAGLVGAPLPARGPPTLA